MEAVAAVMRSPGMETGQRRLARHGLPRLAADAGAGRRDRTAAGAPPDPRAVPDRAPAAGSDVNRYLPAGDAVERSRTDSDPTCAAYGRGTAVQQPNGASSLSGL